MRKILTIITTAFVPYGGLTTVIMNYYRAMDKSGLQIDFASTNETPRVLADELVGNDSRYFCLGDRKKHTTTYRKNLRNLLQQECYDVIHVNGNSATMCIELEIAKQCGVKTRIAHSHNTQCTHIWLHHLLKPIFDRSYTDALACSQAAGAWLFPENHFTVLNNAIDLWRYAYDSAKRKAIREKYHIPDGVKVIGHVGKFTRQKNHTFLLDIFAEVVKREPSAILMLVGDGPLKESLALKAKQSGIKNNVVFCGMQDDASGFYSAFDCMVFPSLYEGFGLALIEAQACGLNCVVSDVIPPEATICETARGGVQRPSLVDSTKVWADSALKILGKDREAESEHNRMLLRENGYDIMTKANTLRELYLR